MQKNIKLGNCPFCGSNKINRYEEEFENAFSEVKPYSILACDCKECKNNFTEYYSIDEVKFEDEEEGEFIFTDDLSKTDKQILLKALKLLVESEGDSKDYTELFKRLKGGVLNDN